MCQGHKEIICLQTGWKKLLLFKNPTLRKDFIKYERLYNGGLKSLRGGGDTFFHGSGPFPQELVEARKCPLLQGRLFRNTIWSSKVRGCWEIILNSDFLEVRHLWERGLWGCNSLFWPEGQARRRESCFSCLGPFADRGHRLQGSHRKRN